MSNDEQKTILIVEDNPAVLEMAQIFLEGEGYKVLTATDGGSALKTAERAMPNLILLDMWIPIMDGSQTAKRLKENQQTKNIPIVMFSAHPKAEEYAKVSGVDALIAKPFDLDELLKMIRQFIGQEA